MSLFIGFQNCADGLTNAYRSGDGSSFLSGTDGDGTYVPAPDPVPGEFSEKDTFVGLQRVHRANGSAGILISDGRLIPLLSESDNLDPETDIPPPMTPIENVRFWKTSAAAQLVIGFDGSVTSWGRRLAGAGCGDEFPEGLDEVHRVHSYPAGFAIIRGTEVIVCNANGALRFGVPFDIDLTQAYDIAMHSSNAMVLRQNRTLYYFSGVNAPLRFEIEAESYRFNGARAEWLANDEHWYLVHLYEAIASSMRQFEPQSGVEKVEGSDGDLVRLPKNIMPYLRRTEVFNTTFYDSELDKDLISDVVNGFSLIDPPESTAPIQSPGSNMLIAQSESGEHIFHDLIFPGNGFLTTPIQVNTEDPCKYDSYRVLNAVYVGFPYMCRRQSDNKWFISDWGNAPEGRPDQLRSKLLELISPEAFTFISHAAGFNLFFRSGGEFYFLSNIADESVKGVSVVASGFQAIVTKDFRLLNEHGEPMAPAEAVPGFNLNSELQSLQFTQGQVEVVTDHMYSESQVLD